MSDRIRRRRLPPEIEAEAKASAKEDAVRRRIAQMEQDKKEAAEREKAREAKPDSDQ